jgi:hypothetical protein
MNGDGDDETIMNYQPETPNVIVDWISNLLGGRSARIICDPWLNDAKLLTRLKKATGAKKAVGLTPDSGVAAAVREAIAGAQIEMGEPLELLREAPTEFDVIAANLPFGMQGTRAIFESAEHEDVELRGELGHLLLVQAALRLKADGVGVFVVSPGFFLHSSVYHKFPDLGLGLDAAVELPAGVFAPATYIGGYILVVRRQAAVKMFAARLSGNPEADAQIISNFRDRKEGGILELGRLVDASTFRGLGAIRMDEQLAAVEVNFGYPSVPLAELAEEVTLGRFGQELEDKENAIFVPMIGATC